MLTPPVWSVGLGPPADHRADSLPTMPLLPDPGPLSGLFPRWVPVSSPSHSLSGVTVPRCSLHRSLHNPPDDCIHLQLEVHELPELRGPHEHRVQPHQLFHGGDLPSLDCTSSPHV